MTTYYYTVSNMVIWSRNGQYIKKNFGVKLGQKYSTFWVIPVVGLFDRNDFYRLRNFASILHTRFYHLNV